MQLNSAHVYSKKLRKMSTLEPVQKIHLAAFFSINKPKGADFLRLLAYTRHRFLIDFFHTRRVTDACDTVLLPIF